MYTNYMVCGEDLAGLGLDSPGLPAGQRLQSLEQKTKGPMSGLLVLDYCIMLILHSKALLQCNRLLPPDT